MKDQRLPIFIHKSFEPTESYIRRRMTPLAILVAVVIGGVTPWLYQESRKVTTQREAEYMATAIVDGVQQLVAREPILWAYKPQSLHALIVPFEKLGAEVSCFTKQGHLAHQSQVNETRQSTYAVKKSIISSNRLEVGKVVVKLRLMGTSSLYTPWILALLTAGIIAWLLFTIPLRSARKADSTNVNLLRRILDLNSHLEQRIFDRTKELETMNTRLLSIQEEERARISRDLHDELGQTLTGLRLQLTALEHRINATEHEYPISPIIDIVDVGIDQVRKIAYEQRPPELDMLGLHEAIKAMTQRLQKQSNLVIEVDFGDLPLLSNELNLTLFRITQEAITNILRHSQANQAHLCFQIKHDQIVLTIEDNGYVEKNQIVWGAGLRGIHGRIEKLNGSFEVGYSASGGVKLFTKIPIDIDT